jgi:hypothetical protein
MMTDQHDAENASGVAKIMLKLHESCMTNTRHAAATNEQEVNRVLHLEADLAGWFLPRTQRHSSFSRLIGISAWPSTLP